MPRILRLALVLAVAMLLAPTLADAGVGSALPVALALAGAALATALGRRWSAAAALALTVGGGGLAVGIAARAADARCRAAAVRTGELVLVLETAARPGSTVRARTPAGCVLAASVQVRAGRGDAGARVRVRGLVLPTERGVRVRDAAVVAIGGGDVRAAWRARVGRVVDRLFGRDAPLVRALVLAEAGAIDPAVRDRYADAGLVHALSVSGLHVSIVGGALTLLLRALRLAPAVATGASVAAVAAYVACIGAPAPAVRAATMLVADAASRLLQRPTSPWAVFAVGAAAPLHDPRAVWDLGYQLSVAGMAALVAGRSVARRLRAREGLPHRLRRGWGAAVLREVLVGALATCATAPLVAWHFGRVSLVGVVANVAAGPLLAALQPTLFLALLLAPLGAAGEIVAAAARPMVALLDLVARGAASVPGAALAVSPTLVGAVLSGAAAVALLAAAGARRPGRPLAAGAACVALAAWMPAVPSRARGGWAELHLLDVGQGDAVALRTPRGRWLLVDAGGGWRGGDAGARTVVPYVRRRGGDVALLVLSHPHADHVGGAASVLDRLAPPRTWDAAFALGSDTYRQVLEAAHRVGSRWQRVRPGDSLTVDGLTLRVLAPDSAWTASLADPNLASVVVAARYGRVRFLLTGDAEEAEERWLVERAARDATLAEWLRADVLKVAHHGSATSSSSAFLGAVRPRLALVSVGAGNGYGHPSPDVLARFASTGVEVLRTDRSGTVVVRTDGSQLEVEAAGERWRVSDASAGPAAPP
ncbi:MAG TPA: DNA internalization-related competence protein ComEC/Rec2 [Gemmatirosa sp.]|nr:DNA internalization-related competence protein ComEC/Rec2 [Gemmatirosa sp.]